MYQQGKYFLVVGLWLNFLSFIFSSILEMFSSEWRLCLYSERKEKHSLSRMCFFSQVVAQIQIYMHLVQASLRLIQFVPQFGSFYFLPVLLRYNWRTALYVFLSFFFLVYPFKSICVITLFF